MRLHDQIVAVEQATTPNRRIDGDVAELLNLQPEGLRRAGGSQPELFKDGQPGVRARTWLAPKLSSSTDAALDLMTPGWRLESLSDKGPGHRARCILARDEGKIEHARVVGYGCNRAAAALAAVLRSKAHDRGSPAPRSTEHAIESAEVIRPDRPKLHVHA